MPARASPCVHRATRVILYRGDESAKCLMCYQDINLSLFETMSFAADGMGVGALAELASLPCRRWRGEPPRRWLRNPPLHGNIFNNHTVP
jgi:hypothetical protein